MNLLIVVVVVIVLFNQSRYVSADQSLLCKAPACRPSVWHQTLRWGGELKSRLVSSTPPLH